MDCLTRATTTFRDRLTFDFWLASGRRDKGLDLGSASSAGRKAGLTLACLEQPGLALALLLNLDGGSGTERERAKTWRRSFVRTGAAVPGYPLASLEAEESQFELELAIQVNPEGRD
ncbi:hypothetical protein ACHAQJ_004084 [Trichoderma viride]